MLAVNAVRDSIAICDYLEPYIADNDKTPSWDGEIMIYDQPNKSRSAFWGKIAVQVKGTCQKNLSEHRIKFSVNVIDLKNYLRTGGAMYFVVYLSEDAQQKKIYYNDLHLVKLKHYINTAKGKTIKIIFKEFPESNNEKELLCQSLCNTCNKQLSFKDNIITLEKLREKSFTLHMLSYLTPEMRNDPFKAVLDSDTAWFVQFEGDSLQMPVDTTNEELAISYEKKCEVKVGNQIFYNQVSVIRSHNAVEISIGQSIKMTFSDDGNLSFNFTLTNSLRNRVIDANFMVTAVLNKGFKLGHSPCKIPDTILYVFKTEELIEYTEKLQDYVNVLDLLQISQDLDVSKLTESEKRSLNILVLAFIKNQPIRELSPNQPPASFIQIGKLKIGIAIEPSKTDKSVYYIHDLFNHDMKVQYKDTNGRFLRTSPYSVLKDPDDYSMANINFATLPGTYKILANENPKLPVMATKDLLVMLLAYDKSPNISFLSAIKELAKWIMEAKTSLTHEINLINLLQVIKRERDLHSEERNKLYDLLENDSPEDIKTAAALLLEDQPLAERHFARMEKDAQEQFKQYPIYYFWK